MGAGPRSGAYPLFCFSPKSGSGPRVPGFRGGGGSGVSNPSSHPTHDPGGNKSLVCPGQRRKVPLALVPAEALLQPLGLPPWKPLLHSLIAPVGAWDRSHRQDNRAGSHARVLRWVPIPALLPFSLDTLPAGWEEEGTAWPEGGAEEKARLESC